MQMFQAPVQNQTATHAQVAGGLQTGGLNFFSPCAGGCRPVVPVQSLLPCPNPYFWGMAATQTTCGWMPPPLVQTNIAVEGSFAMPVEEQSSLDRSCSAPVEGGTVPHASDDLVSSPPLPASCSSSGALGISHLDSPSTPKRKASSPGSRSLEYQQSSQAEPRTPPPGRTRNSPRARVGSPGSLPSSVPGTPAATADRIEHWKLVGTPSPEQYRSACYSSATPPSIQFTPFQPLPSMPGCPSTPSGGTLVLAGTPLESFGSISPSGFFPPCRLGPHIVTPTPPVPFATPPQIQPNRQSQGLTPGPVRHPQGVLRPAFLPPTQLDYSAPWVEGKPS